MYVFGHIAGEAFAADGGKLRGLVPEAEQSADAQKLAGKEREGFVWGFEDGFWGWDARASRNE